jgi:sarcosine oxidase, subunit beta
VRSNYLWDEARAFYEKSLKLWEGLSQELNFNVMFSQRGVLNLAHACTTTPRSCAAGQRQCGSTASTPNARRGAGAADGAAARLLAGARYPVLGALMQRRGGVARHDAVAWGFARAADARRRHHPELRGHRHPRSRRARVVGVETTGADRAGKVGLAVAGHSRCSPAWPACACRSRATRCRPW